MVLVWVWCCALVGVCIGALVTWCWLVVVVVILGWLLAMFPAFVVGLL